MKKIKITFHNVKLYEINICVHKYSFTGTLPHHWSHITEGCFCTTMVELSSHNRIVCGSLTAWHCGLAHYKSQWHSHNSTAFWVPCVSLYHDIYTHTHTHTHTGTGTGTGTYTYLTCQNKSGLWMLQFLGTVENGLFHSIKWQSPMCIMQWHLAMLKKNNLFGHYHTKDSSHYSQLAGKESEKSEN